MEIPGERGFFACLRDSLFLMTYNPLILFEDIWRRYPDMHPVAFYFSNAYCVMSRDPLDNKVIFNSPKMSLRASQIHIDRFTSLLGRNIITVPVSLWGATRRRVHKFLSGQYLDNYQLAMHETAEKFLLPTWKEYAASKQPLHIWNNMLRYSSLVAFMAFMGLKYEDVPEDVYMTLNKLFMHVRSYVQSVFPTHLKIPSYPNLIYHQQWRKLRQFIEPYIEKQKESSTMLGSVIRTYTKRQRKDFDDLITCLNDHVDGPKISPTDEIRDYFELHQNQALIGEFIYYQTDEARKIPPELDPTFDKYQMDFELYTFVQNLLAQFTKAGIKFKTSPLELQAAVESFFARGSELKARDHAFEEIIGNLIGGSETTIVFMNFACYFLAKYPEYQDKLRTAMRDNPNVPLKKINYVNHVLNETLRLGSPAFVTSRVLDDDVSVEPRYDQDGSMTRPGYTIPAGKAIWFTQFFTHRDPEVWPEPEKFNPDRWADPGVPVPWKFLPVRDGSSTLRWRAICFPGGYDFDLFDDFTF